MEENPTTPEAQDNANSTTDGGPIVVLVTDSFGATQDDGEQAPDDGNP